jgi:hypothetical protein
MLVQDSCCMMKLNSPYALGTASEEETALLLKYRVRQWSQAVVRHWSQAVESGSSEALESGSRVRQ